MSIKQPPGDPSHKEELAAMRIHNEWTDLKIALLADCPAPHGAEIAGQIQALVATAIAAVRAGTIVLALWGVAHAAPPPNPDPALAPWFESLTRPDTGTGCCSAADCRPVASRIDGDHYEVWIGAAMFGKEAPDDWVKVPPEKVLQRHDNPVGEPVACWMPQLGILCFIRGPET